MSFYLPSSGGRSLSHLSEILQLEPGDPRCAGYAPTMERRCLKHTNSAGRQTVRNFLELGTVSLYAGRPIDNTFEILARHVLCSIHKSQSRDLIARWKERVRPYAEIWFRSTTRSNLQPASHGQSSSIDRQSVPQLSNLIKLDLEKNHTCAGYAPSMGRPCQNRIGHENRRYAMHLLAAGTTGIRHGERIDLILGDLAPYVVCHIHRSQIPGLVRLWKTLVEPFIQRRTQFTGCLSRQPYNSNSSLGIRFLSRQPYTLNQSQGSPFEAENVPSESSFAQTRNLQSREMESTEMEVSRVFSNLAPETHSSETDSAISESTREESENSSSGSDSEMEMEMEMESSSESSSSEASTLEISGSQTETAPLLPSIPHTEFENVSDTASSQASSLGNSESANVNSNSLSPIPNFAVAYPSRASSISWETTSNSSSDSRSWETTSNSSSDSPSRESTRNSSGDSPSQSHSGNNLFTSILQAVWSAYPGHSRESNNSSSSNSAHAVQRRPTEGDCSICLEKLQGPNLTYCKVKCGVNFHAKCLQNWLGCAPRSTCPMCRCTWKR